MIGPRISIMAMGEEEQRDEEEDGSGGLQRAQERA